MGWLVGDDKPPLFNYLDYGTIKETFHKLCLSARTDGTCHAKVHEPLSCTTDELGSETRQHSRWLDESVAELLDNTTIVMFVPQSNNHGEAFPFETDFPEGQKRVLPMWSHLTIGLELDGKDKTLAVLNLTGVHTLDADGLSPQFVGYLLCHSLAAVVNDNDRFMLHIIILFEYR